MDILEKAKQKLKEQKETEKKPEVKHKKVITKKPEELPDLNKSIELNSIKTLYANRFGSTTNMRKTDMQKALINIWNKENKRGRLKNDNKM